MEVLHGLNLIKEAVHILENKQVAKNFRLLIALKRMRPLKQDCHLCLLEKIPIGRALIGGI